MPQHWMAQFSLNNVHKRGIKHHHFISHSTGARLDGWVAVPATSCVCCDRGTGMPTLTMIFIRTILFVLVEDCQGFSPKLFHCHVQGCRMESQSRIITLNRTWHAGLCPWWWHVGPWCWLCWPLWYLAVAPLWYLGWWCRPWLMRPWRCRVPLWWNPRNAVWPSGVDMADDQVFFCWNGNLILVLIN